MVVCRVRFTLTHARTYNIHRFPTDLCGIRSKIATIIWLTKHYVLVFVESDLLLCIKQSKQSPWLLITCGFSLSLPFVSLTPTSHLDGLILLLALHKWSQYIDRNSERTNTWSTRVVVVDRQPQLRRLTSKRVQQLSRRFFIEVHDWSDRLMSRMWLSWWRQGKRRPTVEEEDERLSTDHGFSTPLKHNGSKTI